MKCIVFGANGYLGSHMVADLVSEGHQLIIPCEKNGSRVDLTNVESLDSIDWGVDVVYMFAGLTGTKVSFENFCSFLRTNELSLLNVLDSIRRSKNRPRVIFPSTRLVYRGSEKPLVENSTLESKTIYAANKIACEQYLIAFSQAYAIPHTIFRICVPYANLLSKHYSYGTVGNLISQAKDNRTIRLYGGGRVRRTFTHIKDITGMILKASLIPETENQTFNIPGENLSVYEAACYIAEKINDVNIEIVDWPDFDFRIESGDTVFAGDKLLETLFWKTRHNFRDWTSDIFSE